MINIQARELAGAFTGACATMKGRGVLSSDRRLRMVSKGNGTISIESFASGTFSKHILTVEGADQEFDICLPAPMCSGIAPFMKDGMVELEVVSTTHVEIKIHDDDSDSSWSIPMVWDEWLGPTIPPVKGSSIVVPAQSLLEAINATNWTLASKLGKVEQDGLSLSVTSHALIVTGASSATVSIISVPGEDASMDEIKSAAITRESIPGLTTGAKDYYGDIMVTIGRAFVRFTGEDFDIVAPVLMERFREYHKLIPAEFESSAKLSTSEVKSAVRSALAIHDRTGPVRGELVVDGDNLMVGITAESDARSSFVKCGADTDGEHIAMAVDMVKFYDMVSAMIGDQFTLSTFKSSVVARCNNQVCLLIGMR